MERVLLLLQNELTRCNELKSYNEKFTSMAYKETIRKAAIERVFECEEYAKELINAINKL